MTKKVTHLLIGDQFGGTKMRTALQRKLKTLDEDELLDIIRKSKRMNAATAFMLI